MVRTRRSNRGRRKRASTSSSARSSKTKTTKNKTPKDKRKSLNISSNSETSPFKGFPETNQSPKLHMSLPKEPENKNDIFDSLFDNHNRNLNRNIKTYTNKHRKTKENALLEFEDSENRYEVIKWLNDTRNVFDRLTQTQSEPVIENDNQMSIDLPSVSQQNTSKLNRSTRESRRNRTPYKLRAKSLDIQVKKNGVGGRCKRHSLAGDSPDLENYHIEEAVTDEEVPTPAENAKVIIDLMEDEYLDNIEREILQQDDKKGGSGWERIKDINKTLNNTKKPKQLNIVLETSQKKNPSSSSNQEEYELEVLETYFIENMEKLLEGGEKSKNKSPEKFSVKNGLQVGKNFLTILKKIAENEGNERLSEFKFLVHEINSLFTVFLKSSATQTRTVPKSTKTTQTVSCKRTVVVQTESNLTHTAAQTILETTDKIVQTEQDKSSVQIQTELNPIQRVESQSTSSTASDLFFENERDRQEVSTVFQKNFNSGGANQNDVFDDDLDLDFDTEELMKKAETSKTESANFSKIEPENKYELSDDDLGAADLNTEDMIKEVDRKVNEIEIIKTGQSDLLITRESRDGGNKGVKRVMQSPVYDPEVHRSKRPCGKFMADDLSVGFNSCVQEDESQEVVKFSEESDVDVNDEYIAKLLKKYENHREQTPPQPPPKTRTQEQIEELENIIHNATKPNRSITNHKQETQRPQTSRNVEDDFDYFNPGTASHPEKTPKSSRRSLFDAKNDDIKTSPTVLSESIFASEKNVTVIADQTFTDNNVDIIMKKVSVSDERKSDKIKILDDVTIRKGKSGAKNDENLSEASDEVHFSDGDFVESTPQKKYPSYISHREESVLDITLPPPLQFQDMEAENEENKSKVVSEGIKAISPPRRPLAVINKVTSTPLPSKNDSENFLSLSPISFPTNKKARFESEENRKPNKKSSVRETIRNFTGENKFSPLSIFKKSQSQDQSSTPKQQRSILNYVRASQESQNSSASFEGPTKRKPCIACSRVSRDQVMAISSLTNKKLASYSTSFSPKVTHLIVSTNERNQLKDHTIKFVGAVAAGIWVLSFGWVQECLQKNSIVPEEPFEVLDVSGEPGPRMSRLMRTTNPLLKGYKIHAAVPFVSTTQQEIENVVRLLGGKVVPAPEYLLDKNGYVCVIVTEARATQDFALYETWLEALKVVTVDIEWLSRSVGQYKLLSLRPFTLCADEALDSLGYPPELTVNMTYSFSQQTFSSVPSSSSF